MSGISTATKLESFVTKAKETLRSNDVKLTMLDTKLSTSLVLRKTLVLPVGYYLLLLWNKRENNRLLNMKYGKSYSVIPDSVLQNRSNTMKTYKSNMTSLFAVMVLLLDFSVFNLFCFLSIAFALSFMSIVFLIPSYC